MPNPSGQNSPVNFQGFVQNPPAYGDKARQGDLQRLSPLAGGGASSALNAPRRAKSRATSGQEQPTMIEAPPADQAQPSYQAMLAQAWAEIASTPGVSPLVQQLAEEAQIGGRSQARS